MLLVLITHVKWYPGHHYCSFIWDTQHCILEWSDSTKRVLQVRPGLPLLSMGCTMNCSGTSVLTRGYYAPPGIWQPYNYRPSGSDPIALTYHRAHGNDKVVIAQSSKVRSAAGLLPESRI